MDDRDLIERWRRGQPDAARTLVGQHYPRILNLFYRLTGTREEAEELTQDLFVRLTRHVAGNEQVEDLAAWLHRVGINLWRDWVRRTMTARQKGITTAGGDEEILRSQAPEEVEAAAMAHWERDVVRQAVLELSEAHREVIVLFYYQGCSYAEIAALTGMPVGTVRSRIHYATQRLYTRLGPNGKGGTKVDPIVKTRFWLDLSYCCSPSLIGVCAAAATALLVVVVVIGKGGAGGNPCGQWGLCG